MKHILNTFAAFFFLGAVAFAQPGQAGGPPPQGPGPAPAAPGDDARRGAPLRMRGGAPMGALHPGPEGRWWGNPELAQKLGITADQQKKMDDILQQHRLSLVDLRATLAKQELTLEPLVSADQPDEGRILGQIDKVAQARAELEKANARMLLDIRRVLTPEQWQKLKAEAATRPAARRGPPAGPAPPPGR